MERHIASEAVRRLRAFLGETQEQFALRMNTAVVTIARWETSRPPGGKALKALEKLTASDPSLKEYEDAFAEARRNSPATRKRIAGVSPIEFKSERETMLARAMLRVIRNPDKYAKELLEIENALQAPSQDIDRLMTSTQVGADVRGAIVRLHKEGRSHRQIGEILGLDPNDVEQVIAYGPLDMKVK